MRIYQSTCPGCGEEIIRAHGEAGEGLLFEDGCKCRADMTGWDWFTVGVVVIAMLIVGFG